MGFYITREVKATYTAWATSPSILVNTIDSSSLLMKTELRAIYQWADQKVTKIGTFLTGARSRILPASSNGVALERVGMRDACKSKSCILLRNPLRVDIHGIRGGATGGMVTYQRCPNVNVESDPEGLIILSHGGDTTKVTPPGWLRWSSDEPIVFDVPFRS